ncbi:response regulator [Lachnospiraceae bacterium]|nr:response regulator [Lachnospiraceae bacterium]
MKKENKHILPVLIIVVAVLAILSIIIFTLENQKNITSNNREYLRDNTSQMAALIDDSLLHGLTNIQMLSNLVGEILTSPEVDIVTLQRILDDSIFDFIEFADKEGINHNTTGGISVASDRQYYLNAMQGKSGIELIFNSRATNETLLMFYSPVYYEGEIIGSLIGAYEGTNQLDKLLTMEVFGYIAEAYLCNEDGVIISSNQDIDTTKELSIEKILGPRILGNSSTASLIYENETILMPLADNETGACIMGLENDDWYIIQIFPEEVNEIMISSTNFIGIVLAAFLVAILLILLAFTYSILTKSKMETQKALVKAENASRAKTDFLFNMSHDIRTPMNAITGFLRLLDKQQEDGAKRKEYIHKIGAASEILLSIINNVLEMSKIESGKAVLNETAWNIEQLFHSMYSLFAAHMQAQNITFEKSVDIQHPFVWCDTAKVQEVYLNILSNAYKYTSNGGKVTMRLTELPSNKEGYSFFKTEIEDNGIGISKDFIPHLFEDFSREQNTTHSKIAGTGLGMSIAKKLTELMNGSIEVESETGKGTKFTVIMAYRIASEEDFSGRKTDDEMAINFSGKRILLAEDNDLNAEIAIELLSEMGLEIERAEDGAICIDMMEQAKEGYYDLILMDIQMPNVNGYQAAEAIRKMDNLSKASIPIVAMTANAFEEDRKNAYAAGMDAHLGKPIDIQKLMETLGNLLC